MYELLQIKNGEKELTKNSFHLTFDDGLSEFYHVAAPILKSYGVPATVFLNSDFIDNKNMFYRLKASILFDQLKTPSILSVTYNNKEQLDDLAKQHRIDFDVYLKEHQPYLSSAQIKELMMQGFTFGAHSLNHPLYSQLTLKEQITQTKESVERITTQFNLPNKVFSFPFTDDGVGARFFDEIKNYTDITFGSAGLKEDTAENHIQRLAMEKKDDAKSILKTEYVYCILKSLIGKNKIIRV
ncbi:MAG: polysaccharide deacetylase family protein [Vicingus serpentipes]|nr:polysaccharide deacetylase family protein [Vicingus serpentipes]